MKRKELMKDGNCYEKAFKYLIAHSGDYADDELFVVHGIVGGFELNGEWVPRHGHAWVEVKVKFNNPHLADYEIWNCIDKSNGNDSEMPRDLYYHYGHVNEDEIKRFNEEETCKMCLKFEHYGPWYDKIYEVEKEEGVGTLPEPKKKKKGRPRIPERTKEKALMMLEGSSRSMADVARRVGVSATTVSRWADERGLKRWF